MKLINAENFNIIKCKGVSKDYIDGANHVLELIHNEPIAFDPDRTIAAIESYAKHDGIQMPSRNSCDFATYIPVEEVIRIIKEGVYTDYAK